MSKIVETLFGEQEIFEDWESEWLEMPEFVREDKEPLRKIIFSFDTIDAVEEVAKKLDINITSQTKSIRLPKSAELSPKHFRYINEDDTLNPIYPVYIISKGRWESRLTSKAFEEIGLPYRIVVEPEEYPQYAQVINPTKIITLPDNFSHLGQGSIPVRNWVWEHSISEGHKRHWLFDDNISKFYRLNRNRRLPVGDGTIFRCAEIFTDRYTNVAFSGLNNIAFAPSYSGTIPPYTLNTRVYSMTLINNELPYRWRGRYNEDTDICLRALKDGWCTIQFNAFLGDKGTTLTMKGGNTDTIYNTGDRRREFAESLKKQHPDVVEVVWKFDRWHHQVDYRPFMENKLNKRDNLFLNKEPNEYGMVIRKLNIEQ